MSIKIKAGGMVPASITVPVAQVNITGGTVGQVLTKTADGSEWKTASAGGATFIYGGTVYTGTITLGEGLKMIASGGTTTMLTVPSVTITEFTNDDLVGGTLTLPNQVLGTITIVNNNGIAVLPGMQQSGTDVLIDLSGFTVSDTWKVYYSHGGSPYINDLTGGTTGAVLTKTTSGMVWDTREGVISTGDDHVGGDIFNWWREYSDGRLEQGGYFLPDTVELIGGTVDYPTITFLRPFKSSLHGKLIVIGTIYESVDSQLKNEGGGLQIRGLTTTSFSAFMHKNADERYVVPFRWRATGMKVD